MPAVEADSSRLRQVNVSGNVRPWNGVDYTEFPEQSKRRIRKHYAALVKQIDYEVGQIIEALKAAWQYENTVIILSSDHGDYLGDHDLIGKASFYESAIRVPMLARVPWSETSAVVDDMVELRDVTATMLGVRRRRTAQLHGRAAYAGPWSGRKPGPGTYIRYARRRVDELRRPVQAAPLQHRRRDALRPRKRSDGAAQPGRRSRLTQNSANAWTQSWSAR